MGGGARPNEPRVVAKMNRVRKPSGYGEDGAGRRKSEPIAYRGAFGTAGEWKAMALEAKV